MKITKIESIKLQFEPKCPPRDGLSNIKTRDVFLVKVHTDNGTFGLGEAFALGTLHSLESIINEVLSPLLIGEDPINIEYLWDKMYRMTFRVGRRGLVIAAISAIDIALWDLLGKLTNQPVYKLLGANSNSVNVYASGGYYIEGKTVEDLKNEARTYLGMGFSAMKMKIGGAEFNEDLERIRAVKSVLGNKARLAIDANNTLDLNTAIRLCSILEKEEIEIFFFEEPISSDDIEGSAYLTSRTTIPIAGYETEYTRYGCKNLISSRAVNILQTDAIWSGGISECRKIATVASTWNMEVIPHFSASAVSLAANLHLSGASTNVKWFEYTLDENPLRDQLSLTPHLVKEGTLIINEKPGIGVELDEEVVSKYRI